METYGFGGDTCMRTRGKGNDHHQQPAPGGFARDACSSTKRNRQHVVLLAWVVGCLVGWLVFGRERERVSVFTVDMYFGHVGRRIVS